MLMRINNGKRKNNITTRRDPLWLFDSLFGDDFFDSVFESPFESLNYLGTAITSEKTEKGIRLQFQVPGYGKNDLSLTYRDGYLTVKDQVKDKETHKLSLTTKLPKEVDMNSFKSTCENGILTVEADYAGQPSETVIRID